MIEKVLLEDHNNTHCIKFKLTFKHDDDDESYFPDESDIDYALDNSMLDQDNEYLVYEYKITDKKVVFIVEVTNDETNEYLPNEEDIEHVMEYSDVIGECNILYIETTFKTITRSQYRDEKLTEIGL
jgi:hypothetical protein